MNNQYVKIPVIVEAIQFLDNTPNMIALQELTGSDLAVNYKDLENITISFDTKHGPMTAGVYDWIVKDAEGDLTVWEEGAFDAQHVPTSNSDLNFGSAIQALKDGHRVAREGWNGKGMWLCLSRDGAYNTRIEADDFWSAHTRNEAKRQGGSALVAPAILMRDASGTIVMGWLASQTDMLADDWCVLPEEDGEE